MARKRGNGEGSIYYSPKLKRWVGQFSAGYKEDGKISRKTLYGKTRKEVAKKIIEKQNELNTNRFVDKSEMLFITLANDIISNQYNANLLSPSSYTRKKETLKQIENTKIANMKIQDITITDINTALAELSYYSNSTINKIYGFINLVLNKAVLLKVIYTNPFSIKGAITKPRSSKQTKKVEALTIDEQKAFIAELEKSNDEYKDILYVAMWTGMRIGEILALKKENVDLINNIIHIKATLTKDENDKAVLGTTTKTYAGTRDIPIATKLKPILSKYIFKEILFTQGNGKLIAPVTINTHFKKICKDAGIQVITTKKKKNSIVKGKKCDIYVNLKTSKVNTHMLRHTYATRCIEAGMSAVVLQRLLGHTDIETTLNTYTSVFNKFKESEIQKAMEYFDAIL